MRRIVHLDADAFYASVEQRDDPRLRGVPVAVGSASGRGVVMTASYEARAFGVKSAMPSAEAARRCPELQFVAPRMDVYREVSREIFAIYRSYTAAVEPLALDEAYLDVSEPLRGPPSGTRIAERIRREVRERTGLTVSAGVSYCKFVAKLASDDAKPDGVKTVPPEAAAAYLADLPVRRIHGVGPRTAERLAALGVATAGDVAAQDPALLEAHFGKVGRDLWRMARGEDDRPVDPNRVRKSVSSETTFARDRVGLAELAEALPGVCDDTAHRARRAGVRGRGVVVKVKDDQHQIHTRQVRLPAATDDAATLHAVAAEVLATRVPLDRPVRLLGVGVTALEDGTVHQPPLFEVGGAVGFEGEREVGRAADARPPEGSGGADDRDAGGDEDPPA